ncbi:YhgE/Pip domain-containing protein [Streptomyces sp. NPDC056144]|uniref:YhgE/Pip domain-containing protein n=1 Tax=unclassified Streptomyces TaxID=2593676 RepID=UPI0035E26634
MPPPSPHKPSPALRVSARGLLRRRSLWLTSALTVGLLSFVLSLLYLGANNDPVGSLKDLPVALVVEDRGAEVGGKHVDLGAQVAEQITASSQLEDKVAWQRVDRAAADELLDSNKVYGALVIPEDFSASVAALAGPVQNRPHPPAMTVLTNPAAGSFGSSMAAEINREVVHTTSTQLGERLTALLSKRSAHAATAAKPGAAAQLMIADPITVTVEEGHPLGDHSGLGLSAFFYTLVLVLGGMLGANVIHAQLDTALGYLAHETGPIRRTRPVQHISRVRHFAVATVLMTVVSALTSALALLAAVGVVGIDAAHLTQLWFFGTCATAAMGITALALLATFGAPGPIVSMLVLIGLAIPSAGATIPLEALPGFYRFLADFEPFRQVVDGVRSILYFDAQAEAGLGRAWAMTGFGFALSLLGGLAVTRFYDRKGLHRVAPDTPAPRPAPEPLPVS